jgi:hypothetical protein
MGTVAHGPAGRQPNLERIASRLFWWVQAAGEFSDEWLRRAQVAGDWLRRHGVFGGVKMPEVSS